MRESIIGRFAAFTPLFKHGIVKVNYGFPTSSFWLLINSLLTRIAENDALYLLCSALFVMNINWKVLPRADASKIINAINPFLGEFALPAGNSPVRVARLPFYTNYQFYELTDIREAQPKSMFALYNPNAHENGVLVLDWTNRPIYTANEQDPLALRQDNLADYLGFFFACVQGPYGPMTIVENLEPPPKADAEVKKVVADVLTMTPPRVANFDRASGTFTVYAAMLFKDCIFKTKIEVSHTGLIQIIEHELAIGGLNQDEAQGTSTASLV